MKRFFTFPAMTLGAALGALGCSANASGGDEFDTPGGNGGGSGNGAGGSISIGGTGGGGGSGSGDPNCANGTELVYVLDDDNELYSFNPALSTPDAFRPIARVACSAGAGPNSMAIGRDGKARIAYVTAASACAGVFDVSIDDGACLGRSNLKCGGGSGFGKFGMGYATDAVGGTTDTLYLGVSFGAPKLGRVDAASGNIANVGSLPGGAEFTGNANAELWGFFPDETPPAVLQIDKGTAREISRIPLRGLPSQGVGGVAYAFAFWGGNFYVFYQVDSTGPGSIVYKVSPSGQFARWISGLNFRIVGAGVSTCAPVIPPN